MDSEPEPADEAEEDDPVTLDEHEQALVLALEGVARIALHLSTLLQKQPTPSSHRAATELKSIYVLCNNQAGRLANHYDIPLMYTHDFEPVPVTVPPAGTGLLSDRLVRLLANAFAEVVPPGVSLEVQDGALWCSTRRDARSGASGTIFGRDEFDDATDPRDERIVRMSAMALRRLRKFVNEFGAEQWLDMALDSEPHAVIEGSQLRLFLGEPGAAVLELPPIEL